MKLALAAMIVRLRSRRRAMLLAAVAIFLFGPFVAHSAKWWWREASAVVETVTRASAPDFDVCGGPVDYRRCTKAEKARETAEKSAKFAACIRDYGAYHCKPDGTPGKGAVRLTAEGAK